MHFVGCLRFPRREPARYKKEFPPSFVLRETWLMILYVDKKKPACVKNVHYGADSWVNKLLADRISHEKQGPQFEKSRAAGE